MCHVIMANKGQYTEKSRRIAKMYNQIEMSVLQTFSVELFCGIIGLYYTLHYTAN